VQTIKVPKIKIHHETIYTSKDSLQNTNYCYTVLTTDKVTY